MGLFDKLKRKVETTLSESRLEEELLYKHVLEEMEAGIIRDGLFAKALANSSGDEDKAKSLYMKYRVRSVKDALNGESYLEYAEQLKLKRPEKQPKNTRRIVKHSGQPKSYLKSKLTKLTNAREKVEKKLNTVKQGSKPTKKELELNRMKLIIEIQKIEKELKSRFKHP